MNIIVTIFLTIMSFGIGFLAQRSRMCFISGIRDFILVRDKELLYGFISFLATIWLLTSIFYGMGLVDEGIPKSLFSEYSSTGSTVVSESEYQELEAESENTKFSKEQLSYELRISLIGENFIITSFLWASLIGGFILGLVSVRVGGCALRQHVLAAQGHRDAWYYVLGFFSMVFIYELFLREVFNELL